MQPYTDFEEHTQQQIREEIPDIADLLKEMIAKGASDLHIPTESPPMIRVSGRLQSLPYRELDPATTKALMYSVMTEEQKRLFEENLELDFSFGLSGMARDADCISFRSTTASICC